MSDAVERLRERGAEALWNLPTAGMALTWADEEHETREYFRKCFDTAVAVLGVPLETLAALAAGTMVAVERRIVEAILNGHVLSVGDETALRQLVVSPAPSGEAQEGTP